MVIKPAGHCARARARGAYFTTCKATRLEFWVDSFCIGQHQSAQWFWFWFYHSNSFAVAVRWLKPVCARARARGAYFTTQKATGLSYQHNSKSRGHHPGAQNFWLWSQCRKTLDVASRWLKHVDLGPSVNRSHQKLTIFQQHLSVWHFVLGLY